MMSSAQVEGVMVSYWVKIEWLENESFLTYFRFLSSHTTVPAVRHTAV